MPVMETRSVVRVTLHLDSETFAAYEQQAAEQGMKVEDLLVSRLARCRDHTASQGLYFNDVERQELTHITGGHIIASAVQALARIRNTLRVRIGKVEIDVDQRLSERIYHRARAMRTTPEEWIKREGLRSLRQECGLG